MYVCTNIERQDTSRYNNSEWFRTLNTQIGGSKHLLPGPTTNLSDCHQWIRRRLSLSKCLAGIAVPGHGEGWNASECNYSKRSKSIAYMGPMGTYFTERLTALDHDYEFMNILHEFKSGNVHQICVLVQSVQQKKKTFWALDSSLHRSPPWQPLEHTGTASSISVKIWCRVGRLNLDSFESLISLSLRFRDKILMIWWKFLMGSCHLGPRAQIPRALVMVQQTAAVCAGRNATAQAAWEPGELGIWGANMYQTTSKRHPNDIQMTSNDQRYKCSCASIFYWQLASILTNFAQ